MQGKIQLKMLVHGLVLLLAASLPFILGTYRTGGLIFLLLVLWPFVCFLSPYTLTRSGMRWYFALPLTPVFFILPMCVLLTPAGLSYLGAYPFLYALVAAVGTLLGMRSHRVKQSMNRSGYL